MGFAQVAWGVRLTESMESSLRLALAPHYALVRVIGHGGMATVYLAESRELSRRVAIKVLDSEVASELGPVRFEREIRIVADLGR